ncbi:MAG: GTP-binding protein [Nitrospirae bacterium]|nr:MAG: GTP-binding protein [Nitrospirota bacterium]
MKTTIVCGLLGSGKTTFIRNMVSASPLRTVVLVNDFGKAGIDGDLFADAGIDSVELPSGCVCCSLRSDLITTIRKIRAEHAPEQLIIEPSGIASPDGVIGALEELGIRQYSVIGVVDVSEFLELYEAEMYGDFFREQITSSDIILINKADRADEDLLKRTTALIESLNPRAVIYRTVKAVISEPLPEVPEARQAASGSTAHRGRLRFDTISLSLAGDISHASMEAFLGDLGSERFGRVVRVKALLQTDRGPARFDLAYGNISSSLMNNPVRENRVVIIGEYLETGLINAEASRHWQAALI